LRPEAGDHYSSRKFRTQLPAYFDIAQATEVRDEGQKARRLILIALFLLFSQFFCLRAASSQESDSLFSKAKAYQDRGLWELAEESYRQFLQRTPSSAMGHSNLGVVYAHERRFQDAAREYQSALSIDPSLTGVYLNLGIAYFQAEEYGTAAPALEKFLSHNPGSRQGQELLGLCYLELDKFDSAVSMLAPLRGDGSPDVLLALSAAYIRLRRMHEAVNTLNDLLDSPRANTAQVHFMMGQTYAGLNNFPQALEEFKKVRTLDQGWPDILLLLGATEARLGLFQEAELDLRDQLRVTPRSFGTLFTLGALLNKERRFQDAIPFLLRAKRLNSKDGEVVYQLAAAYWKIESREAAWGAIREAVRLDPQNGPAHYLYAQIARQRGDQAEAQKEFAMAESLSASRSEQDILRLSEESRNRQAVLPKRSKGDQNR
jgi:tetratricopeptide (TPR) repeat protein